ncbi:hypothetical protein [Nonomuraea sp. NPDC049141]|uniref:hypothetical protein n=1 Tax=Nonomuraea sp. NPDC049141 TaxID=3155500 RepID=UPI0033F86AB7
MNMQAIFTACIAVAGTLLGSLATYIFQSRTAGRAQNFARAEQFRQERLTAYSTFAGAVLDLRSKQGARWGAKRRLPSDPVSYAEAKAAQVLSRTTAWQSLYRVRLVADGKDVTQLATAAMDLAADIDKIQTLDELDGRMAEVRNAVERFIDEASKQVR